MGAGNIEGACGRRVSASGGCFFPFFRMTVSYLFLEDPFFPTSGLRSLLSRPVFLYLLSFVWNAFRLKPSHPKTNLSHSNSPSLPPSFLPSFPPSDANTAIPPLNWKRVKPTTSSGTPPNSNLCKKGNCMDFFACTGPKKSWNGRHRRQLPWRLR